MGIRFLEIEIIPNVSNALIIYRKGKNKASEPEDAPLPDLTEVAGQEGVLEPIQYANAMIELAREL